MSRRWIYLNKPIAHLINDAKLTGLSEIMLKILVNRGINTTDKIISFLYSGLKDLLDTRLMQDANRAIEIIINSLKNKEKIVIYGDYDCDGVIASVVMVKALQNVGGNVEFYTNNRFIDGYGICPNGVDEILNLYPNTKLIITVDNGIMGHEGIKYAKSKGIKVVVTDHHEQGETLPSYADAIVDPKRKDCPYPFKGLCGAGVAFKLMLLLYYELGEKLQLIYDMLDLVTLATVGDVVPIIDENRIIVKEGLKLIREEKRPIFKIFREVTGISDMNAHFTLGFIYCPMINAIGRLDGDPRRAIQMFLNTDEEQIYEDLNYLKELNERRKKLTEEQVELAEETLKVRGLKEAIIVYNEDFHEGVVGLIAGRLKEKYNRPTIVFTKEKGVLKGSARSIDELHIKEVFDMLSPLLKSYGGHAKAAGLSIEEENLDKFEEELINICKDKLKSEDFIKKYKVDCVLKPGDISYELIDELKQLEPFGEGFLQPVLAIKDFVVDKVYFMGNEKQHLKLVSPNNLSMIVWREASAYKDRGEPQRVMALGYPEINVFNNNVNLQFIVNEDNFIPANYKKL